MRDKYHNLCCVTSVVDESQCHVKQFSDSPIIQLGHTARVICVSVSALCAVFITLYDFIILNLRYIKLFKTANMCWEGLKLNIKCYLVKYQFSNRTDWRWFCVKRFYFTKSASRYWACLGLSLTLRLSATCDNIGGFLPRCCLDWINQSWSYVESLILMSILNSGQQLKIRTFAKQFWCIISHLIHFYCPK